MSVSRRDFKRRLHDGSILADPRFHAPNTGSITPLNIARDDTQHYGVEREGNDIEIALGMLPPFKVPVPVAIKFALLILRKCGVEVDNGQEAQ